METLNKHFGEVFHNAFNDAELKRLEADIALCLVREHELAARVEGGESSGWRAATLELVLELEAAIKDADGGAIFGTLLALKDWVGDAVDRDGTWAEIAKNSLLKSKLTVDATAVETKHANVLTGRGAVSFMLAVFTIVKQEAGEEAAYRIGQRFKTELAEVLQGGAAESALPARTA